MRVRYVSPLLKIEMCKKVWFNFLAGYGSYYEHYKTDLRMQEDIIINHNTRYNKDEYHPSCPKELCLLLKLPSSKRYMSMQELKTNFRLKNGFNLYLISWNASIHHGRMHSPGMSKILTLHIGDSSMLYRTIIEGLVLTKTMHTGNPFLPYLRYQPR